MPSGQSTWVSPPPPPQQTTGWERRQRSCISEPSTHSKISPRPFPISWKLISVSRIRILCLGAAWPLPVSPFRFLGVPTLHHCPQEANPPLGGSSSHPGVCRGHSHPSLLWSWGILAPADAGGAGGRCDLLPSLPHMTHHLPSSFSPILT